MRLHDPNRSTWLLPLALLALGGAACSPPPPRPESSGLAASPPPPSASATDGPARAAGPATAASPPAPSAVKAPPKIAAPSRSALAAPRSGTIWVLVSGAFDYEDVLLLPDGTYITHLHHHPGASGSWALSGATLTLESYGGDGALRIEGVAVHGGLLTGTADGEKLVFEWRP